MEIRIFRKRPVEILAVQLTQENAAEVAGWIGDPALKLTQEFDTGLCIETLEGVMCANWGDWIIKGVKGEFYPCKPDIFAQTYTEVTGDNITFEMATQRLYEILSDDDPEAETFDVLWNLQHRMARSL